MLNLTPSNELPKEKSIISFFTHVDLQERKTDSLLFQQKMSKEKNCLMPIDFEERLFMGRSWFLTSSFHRLTLYEPSQNLFNTNQLVFILLSILIVWKRTRKKYTLEFLSENIRLYFFCQILQQNILSDLQLFEIHLSMYINQSIMLLLYHLQQYHPKQTGPVQCGKNFLTRYDEMQEMIRQELLPMHEV